MKNLKKPVKDSKDDHNNNSNILNPDPKKPHFLNSPLHEPKLQPGVASVEDISKKKSA